jgi:hypothetical protein
VWYASDISVTRILSEGLHPFVVLRPNKVAMIENPAFVIPPAGVDTVGVVSRCISIPRF